VHRDGAKTTKCRIYTAKKIAYGIARTILYIGKSEGHALRSVKWIRKQVQYNKPYAQTFNLKPGSKWQDLECEIVHGVEEHTIWILAMGIGGSVRGILPDDFRPDLIILDDVLDEENSATDEGRKKISKLVYGALKNTLAPATEAPEAKMVSLATPQHKEDYATKALKDQEWRSAVYGCWTQATQDLPLDKQESSWPARYPSKTLRKEKQYAIDRNELSTWTREKECKLTTPETCDFDFNWLKYYELDPPGGTTVCGVDPVPPPSDKQIAQGMAKKDFEAFGAVTKYQGNYYVRRYEAHRGHDPDWSIQQFFQFGHEFNPRSFIVETVAYQKTLMWIFKKAMSARGIYYFMKDFKDKRRKRDRILDGLKSIASEGRLYVKKDMYEFIMQFSDYPDVSHEDILEVIAIICGELQGLSYVTDEADSGQDHASSYKQLLADEEQYESLGYAEACP